MLYFSYGACWSFWSIFNKWLKTPTKRNLNIQQNSLPQTKIQFKYFMLKLNISGFSNPIIQYFFDL